MKLTGKQLRFLRARGHALSPHVQLSELSDAVLAEAGRQLEHHELIKIKVSGDDRDERSELIAALAQKLDAQEVQQLGKTALLYRANPEAKKPIILPQSRE